MAWAKAMTEVNSKTMHPSIKVGGSPDSPDQGPYYRPIPRWPLTSGGSWQAELGYLDPLEPQGAVTEQSLLNQGCWHR